MSYDFAIAVETGGSEPHYIEPYFADEHPALGSEGLAGTAVATATGYARCGNYTSNVSGMWARCLTAAMQGNHYWQSWARGADRRMREQYESQRDRTIDTEHLHLRDLAGKPCEALAPLLVAAVKWGVDHIEELREMNPSNGWGDAEGAVTYLWDIQRMCEQHPRGRLYISS